VVGRRRFRVRHVEGGRQPSALQFGHQRIGVDDAAPRNVHDESAVLQLLQEAGVDELPGRVCQRHHDHDDVGGREQVGELVGAVHTLVGPGPAGDAHDRSLERQQSPLDSPPDRAVAQDQDGLVGQRRVRRVPPLAGVLTAHEVRNSTQAGEHQGQGELGGAGVMNAVGVAQRDAVRNVGQRVFVAGRQQLHHPKARHLGS
jgi:hypothetical protein